MVRPRLRSGRTKVAHLSAFCFLLIFFRIRFFKFNYFTDQILICRAVIDAVKQISYLLFTLVNKILLYKYSLLL